VGAAGARFAGFEDLALRENIVQEVFVRAFSERARLAYDGIRAYRNYLFAIAKHLVIDELRTRKRQYVTFDERDREDGETEISVDPATDPSVLWDHQEVAAIVDEFVDSLQEEERKIFTCRFRDGLSIEATVATLGLTEHHIKRAERSIRKRFFYQMQRKGFFEGYRADDLGIAKIVTLLLLWAAANVGSASP